MSLPWKSDLTLRLSRRRCRAWLAEPWSRTARHQVCADGVPVESLPAALDALQAASGRALPQRARLLLADEFTYLRLRPASRRWTDALKDAQSHFEQVLGDSDFRIQVAQRAMGNWWLAAAVHGPDLDAWSATVATRGVRFGAIEPGLMVDLTALAPHFGDRGVLALLRDEGVSLVRFASGLPVELAWERCDPHAPRCIEHRMLAFQKTSTTRIGDPLAMVCADAEQAKVWQPQAKAYGWALLTHGEKPPSAAVAARSPA